jgi:hypothetical protein
MAHDGFVFRYQNDRLIRVGRPQVLKIWHGLCGLNQQV